jgi:hypothetical protein
LALVQGLPPEAATWRVDRWTPAMDTAVFAVERADQWSRALYGLLAGKEHGVPGPLEITRPGDEPPESAAKPASVGLAALRSKTHHR